MKNLVKLSPVANDLINIEFAPSQEQVDALAHRLMPEIKKYFANEQIQREFREWKENQKMA